MAIEVFNRYENKYLINSHALEKLEMGMAAYMEPDDYSQGQSTYSITNLYYDTPDSHMIRTSLAKPKYKEKLRLRSYGVPNHDSMVFVEIKKKVCGLTNKRRSALLLPQAYSFLQSAALPGIQEYMNPQVLREVQYILQCKEIQPALYLAYERRAYFGICERDLRISFDCKIRVRRTDLQLEAGDHGEQMLEKDHWLMEVKSSRSLPLWLVQLLSNNDVYPTSFSKYGVAHMNRVISCQSERCSWQAQPARRLSLFIPRQLESQYDTGGF